MAELLIELRSEEIPARMQVRAGQDLRKGLEKGLTKAGLSVEGVSVWTGPRRLGYAATVPDRSPDVREERKGPRVGSPEQALAGFLRAAGLDDISQAETREGKKGEYYVAVIDRPGRAAADIVAEVLANVMRGFPWPKSMRSGTSDFRWVRPLRGIVCLLDGEVVPLEVGGVASGNTTEGHRQHGPGPFAVTSLADYREQLEGPGHVVLDHGRRLEIVRENAPSGTVEDEGLLNEVAGLVEWPVVLEGEFDARFLALPPEVVRLTLKSHQKTFTVRDGDKLANRFVIVANLDAPDGGETIRAGNRKVIEARLSDAEFFMAQDAKKTLAEHAEGLERVVFHDKLGSFADKVERVAALAREIAPHVGADPELAEEAARLAKADLVTQTVIEMTSLQGQVGRLMAEREGLDPAVAQAIEEHYKPQGPSDAVPTEPVSVAVALADKLDSLVAFWAIDEKPTGSKDPYALRRAALGVVRIVLENKISFENFGDPEQQETGLWGLIYEQGIHWFGEDIERVEEVQIGKFAEDFREALQDGMGNSFLKSIESSDVDDRYERARPFLSSRLRQVSEDTEGLIAFLHDRLRVYLRDQGHRHDVIDAVISQGGDDLLAIARRVEALGGLLGTGDGENLVAGYKRAANILRAERKKGELELTDFDALDGFSAPEAETLHAALADVRPVIDTALEGNDYPKALEALASLRGPVDAFFEGVMVNAEEAEARVRRLSLLEAVVDTAHRVADFSKLDG